MRASELMKQENFGEILAETMSRFFSLHFGGEWIVSWNGTADGKGSQRWLVNTFINAVFVPGIDQRALEVVRREFGTSVVAWKRPLQRGYFRMATSRTARLMAQASVMVNRSVPQADRWLIVPSTHKVRFIDSAARVSYCCRKSKSDPGHFRREMDARRFAEQHSVPVPHMNDVLSDDCLAEPMIAGTPLNRLTSSYEQGDGLRLAFSALERLYEATRRTVTLSDYTARVASQIKAAAAGLPTILSSEVVDLADGLRELLGETGEAVELVRSHGDFQPGNILYDRGQVWLIDWEYSKERSAVFDRLTYELRARFSSGLGERITRRSAASEDRAARRDLRLFVLETLLFECDQVIAAPGAMPRALLAKLPEFRKALPALCGNPGGKVLEIGTDLPGSLDLRLRPRPGGTVRPSQRTRARLQSSTVAPTPQREGMAIRGLLWALAFETVALIIMLLCWGC